MNRKVIFNDFEGIDRCTSLKEIKNVLLRTHEWLNLNQIKLDSIETLKNNAKHEIFIDKRIQESQLSDLEYCLSLCSENQITEAVFRLDNFITPFSYILNEPISEFERACVKLMITHIVDKIEELQ